MEKKFTFVILLAFLSIFSAFAESNEHPLINFAGWPSISSPIGDHSLIEKKWYEMEVEKRKKIERILLMDLGLSSTGQIEAIGCYKSTESNKLGEEGERIFHFIQRDLMGSRLFWSCLVNTDSMSVQILYHTSGKIPFGEIKEIEMNP